MFKKIISNFFILLLPLLLAANSFAKGKTENVILISLDGMRWQEVFKGVDKRFFDQDKYIKYGYTHENFKNIYWDNDEDERRKKLFPFIWNVIGKNGQLYGNRDLGSYADLTNKFYFSYPGYNEMLTGFADPRISSNGKILNPNKTFLEWLDEKAPYKGKTAAFASWDVFPYIINQERSDVFLNSDFDDMEELNSRIKDLNQIQRDTPSPWDTVRLDVFTHEFAVEYMKEKKPRALYISYGETDDFAHDGHYDLYIHAAKRTDDFIRRVWEYVESDPHYAGKTTLLITTDHGRGYDSLENWRHHGEGISPINGSGDRDDKHIWMAVIGPDTPANGEMKNTQAIFQNQIAATLMKFLGLEYQGSHPEIISGKPINSMFKK
ncbi:alkaline phosphatase family protein [Pseudemcibacter aquimaris]|uniref:alkaline phosphatase family protein n=1 Tax=Pseudemcibacter aquimaris TaxID=2857064 RepID=UPI002010CFC1|nr:alkaline phosphatase family protein [Pseudemcibacter aquimaris]MCC3860253.1 alkaline phosphatase family protein [Pseudemcibacter aquimaris]WDU57578.1 alkaline phosphatase family protein [Pseudemcibacter aquimaris]